MKIYTLVTRLMNGTVTMNIITDNFSTKELAEKVLAKLTETNKNSGPFKAVYEIKETTLFTAEEEVPILNKTEEKK